MTESVAARPDDEGTAMRQGRLRSVLAFTIALIGICWSAELHIYLRLTVFTEQMLATMLGLTLALIYLRVPASSKQDGASTPLYDKAAAAVGFATAAWLAFRYPVLIEDFFYRRDETFAIGLILIPLVVEAMRRTSGWSLTIVLLGFIAYGLFGDVVPGQLQGRAIPPVKLVSFLGVDNVAMLGLPMTIICTVVILFIFMGQLLHLSGASAWFTDIAAGSMGRTRGGSAKIAIVASSLFGTISGAAVSNVASTGVITIPLMRDSGYSRRAAGAIEAVASTGGQIMPPIMGAAAFLMAEFLEISYGEVVIAAIIPGILYYVALFVQVDLEAARQGISRVPEDRIPVLRRVIREGWFFVLPFVVLIYALFALNLRAETAALYAALTIIVVSLAFGYKGLRIDFRRIVTALRRTGESSAEIIVIGAMAGMVIGLVDHTGLGFGLTFVLVQLGESNLLLLLLLTGVVCIILGMGMPTTAIYFLLATLAAPPLVKLGVEPKAAHLFVLYLGVMSMITPPVAIAAFAAANLAGAKPMETAVLAVKLGWTAYVVPFLFVLSPNLIMVGAPLDVAIAVVTAVVGVWIASSGMMGYFLTPLSAVERLLFLVTGLSLLVPARALEGGEFLRFFGLALLLLVIGREILKRRARKPA